MLILDEGGNEKQEISLVWPKELHRSQTNTDEIRDTHLKTDKVLTLVTPSKLQKLVTLLLFLQQQ